MKSHRQIIYIVFVIFYCYCNCYCLLSLLLSTVIVIVTAIVLSIVIVVVIHCNCQMSRVKVSYASNVDHDLSSAINLINSNSSSKCNCEELDYNYNYATTFKITTMTILLSFDLNFKLDLPAFVEWCINDNKIDKLKVQGNDGVWSLETKPGFFNCVVLRLRFLKETDKNTATLGQRAIVPKTKCIAIKIFSNGNLHITGVQSVVTAILYGQVVQNLFHDFYLGKSLINISYFNIQLINGCFKIHIPCEKVLCLKTLYSKFDEYLGRSSSQIQSCIFNIDHHPGVRVKFNPITEQSLSNPSPLPIAQKNKKTHLCSIIVFESGSVLINAFLSGHELSCAHSFITKFICEQGDSIFKHQVEKPKNLNRKRKRNSTPFDYSKYIN